MAVAKVCLEQALICSGKRLRESIQMFAFSLFSGPGGTLNSWRRQKRILPLHSYLQNKTPGGNAGMDIYGRLIHVLANVPFNLFSG
jgi:hypothetical protein